MHASRVARTSTRMRLMRACAIAALSLTALSVLPAAAGAVTISGTAMKDEQGTTFQGCNGLSPNIAVAVDGVAAGSTSCNAVTGAFSLTGVTIPAAGSLVTIWYDGVPGARGVLYTTAVSTVANITGLTLTQHRAWVRSEQVARNVTGSDLDAFDQDQDADIPLRVAGNITIDSGFEVHVDDVTLEPQTGLTATSIHVASGGTFEPGHWTSTTLTGAGTQACDTGPGVARPLCVEAGGAFIAGASTIDYAPSSGTAAVEPLSYYRLYLGDAGTKELGYANGQTITVADSLLLIEGVIDSGAWPTDVIADWIELQGTATWSGSSSFTISVDGDFIGGGVLALPGADVEMRSTEARTAFGPIASYNGPNGDWTVRSVELSNGGYLRHAWGAAATGMTAPHTSAAGANNDVVMSVTTSWSGTFVVFNQPTNGGDWGIIKYGADGLPDTDWDDGDVNGVDNDGDAVLTFNSGGAQVDVARVAQTYGCDIIVGGSANGNWHARQYDCNGALDTGFFGTGSFTWAGSGATDELRGFYWSNSSAGPERFVAIGTEATATPRWAVRTYDPNTWALDASYNWNNGGIGAEVRAVCGRMQDNWYVYVAGRTGTAGSRDWAVRRIAPDATGWDTIDGGAASWVWNAGGTEDEATSCSIGENHAVVAGTTGTGANDDIRLRAFETWSGDVITSYGTAGTVSLGGVGDDNAHTLLSEGYTGNVFVGGSDPTNGGRAFITRVDADGQVDASWGTAGTVTWDATAGEESVRAMGWSYDEDRLLVGVRHGQNAGDVAIREYDYNGDLQTSVTNGTVRVLARNAGDGRTVNTTGNFAIGRSGDPGAVLLDLESHDPTIDVGGDFNLRTGNAASFSSTSPLTIDNDSTFNGTMFPNLSTIRFGDQAYRSIINVSATAQFHNLRIVEPEKYVAFETTDSIRVEGTFYVRGQSCTSVIDMDGNGAGDWVLDLSGGGVADVQYARITDATAAPIAATATNSFNGGGNTNFAVAGCAGAVLNAPNGLQVDGVYRPRGVSAVAPMLDWFNRAGRDVDRGDVEVLTSPATGQVALWRFDGNGTDSSGNAYTITPANGATYSAGRYGQGAQLDAVDDIFSRADPGAFTLQQFTVDGWVRTTFPGAVDYPSIVYKGNGGGTQMNYRLGYDRPTDEFYAEFTTGGGTFVTTVVPGSAVGDGEWHHLAMTAGNGLMTLYIDGIIADTADYTGSIDSNVGWPIELGDAIGGQLDDWRILSRAAPADEILGYYRTGAPHYQEVWDFDPTDTNGSALGATYVNGARPPVPYGGGAGSLRLDGARYWVRARFRTTAAAVPPNTWSNWSQWDWFETSQSMTVALVDGPIVGVGEALIGQDSTSTTSIDVTTTNVHGWTAEVVGPSDTWGLSNGLSGAPNQIPRIGSPTTPAVWPAGTGGFGLAVLSATGGKDTARWGTGTAPTDFTNVKWAAPMASQSMLLHERTAYDATTQSVELGLRANAPLGTEPGRFTSTVVVTVLPRL